MNIGYAYAINAFLVKSTPTLQEVVTEIELTLIGSYDGVTYSQDIVASIGEPTPGNFIEFQQISESNAIDWVVESESVRMTREHIRSVIEEEIRKRSTTKKEVPWGRQE